MSFIRTCATRTPPIAIGRVCSSTARKSGVQRGFSTAVDDKDCVIVSAVRTPIAAFNGAFASMPSHQLGTVAVKAAVERAGIKGSDVQEVYLGNVVAAGSGQAPARQATLGAEIPESVPCTTVNKVCASGMKTVMMAAQSIMCGHQDIMVAGGFESMSNIPYYLPKARTGLGLGNGAVVDGLVHDGLWDPYNNQHMGVCAEVCADTYGISREEQDAYATQSYARSAAATSAGKFDAEIVPVDVPQRRGDPVTVSVDQEFTNIKLDKLPTLRPAFKKDGTVTAANSSTINDGACALVIMSGREARERGLSPLARIRGFADAAKAPVEFTTAPADAVPLALKMAGLELGDCSYHEINEAFSVVALANQKILGLDPETVNVNGGAVSLGHPIGCSGARILTTLVNVLKQNDATFGTASICNGGGGASAMVIENL